VIASAQHVVFGVLLAAAALVAAWIVRKAMKAESSAHTAYVEDRFGDIRWRWEYDAEGKPVKFLPFCTKCGDRLVDTVTAAAKPYIKLACKNCGNELPRMNMAYSTLKLKAGQRVRDIVKSGKWRQAIIRKRA